MCFPGRALSMALVNLPDLELLKDSSFGGWISFAIRKAVGQFKWYQLGIVDYIYAILRSTGEVFPLNW